MRNCYLLELRSFKTSFRFWFIFKKPSMTASNVVLLMLQVLKYDVTGLEFSPRGCRRFGQTFEKKTFFPYHVVRNINLFIFQMAPLVHRFSSLAGANPFSEVIANTKPLLEPSHKKGALPLWCHNKTYYSTLPKLPVPPLDQTLLKYLKAAKAAVPVEDWRNTEKVFFRLMN